MSVMQMLLLGSVGEGAVSLSNSNAYASDFAPATATATYTLGSDGSISSTGNPSAFWIDPQLGMPAFECRATLVAGSITSGTVGSWLSLGTNRSWESTRSIVGSQSGALDIEIRKIGTTTVLATARITVAVDIF